jgi:20S proteasome alpha/beta subunit
MITSGDVEFETDMTKVFLFTDRVLALHSGDQASHYTIAEETYHTVQKNGITDVGTVARLYAQNFAALRLRRAAAIHLTPLGLDAETFLSGQHQLPPDLVNDLIHRIRCESLGVETILAGVDSTGGHIYSVGGYGGAFEVEDCHATCRDGGGFWAIGSGARQFQTEFMSQGYSRWWPFTPALLLACKAKRRAEVSPGVGTKTDIYVIERSRSIPIDPDNMKLLGEYLDEYQTAAKAKWEEVVTRISNDARLIAQRQQEQEKELAEKTADDANQG